MSVELEAGVPQPVGTPTRPAVRIGKYELVRRIAVGGMAELYLAKESSLHGFQRTVVLKCILPQHADNPEFIDLLINEARLAALLIHPNLAQVYDIGFEDGRYFLVMEHVDGHDLRAVVRAAGPSAPMPIEHVLSVAIGIASGLHHAHEATDLSGRSLGLVHRDVSPSNVLLTGSGGVKLVDFGIAKAYALQPRTQVGALKGKVPYMSPEQCRSELLDRRSDIFSLGTLLWELSVGARLFRHGNSLDTMQCIARGEVPRPSAIRSDYPRELERIVMRALAADVHRRYQTAQQLQLDLEDFGRDHRIRVSATRLGQYVQRVCRAKSRDPASTPTATPQPAPVSADPVNHEAATIAESVSGAASGSSSSPIVTPSPTNRSSRRRLVALAGAGLLMVASLMVYALGFPPDMPANADTTHLVEAAEVHVSTTTPSRESPRTSTPSVPTVVALPLATTPSAPQLLRDATAKGEPTLTSHAPSKATARARTTTTHHRKSNKRRPTSSRRSSLRATRKSTKYPPRPAVPSATKSKTAWDPNSALPPPG